MVNVTVRPAVMPVRVQAGLRLHEIAGCDVRSFPLDYGYAFRCRAALANNGPQVSPGGELRLRLSGEACGLNPGSAFVILVRNAG